jgi:hypothetical protein
VGESLKGLTIAELFAKLLGLVDTKPEEPKGLIDTIIKNEIPMYSISNSGELTPITFKLIDASATPTESGFFVARDAEGKIVEAGYQDLSINHDEMYYMIALLKEIDYNTMVSLFTWDPDDKTWVDSDLELTNDPAFIAERCDEVGISVPNNIDSSKYTIWASEELCTGSIIRYIIKEA